MLEQSIKTLYTRERVTGIVTGMTSTEIQVDLGTKHAGYIPMSEYSDDPNVKPEQELKIGDEIECIVTRVNDVEGTAQLSKKQLDVVKNWAIVEAAVENGNVLEGTVVEDNKGGIVVSVLGVRVFVPMSQTGLGKDVPTSSMIKKPVKLRITEINRQRRRVIGSIRSVLSEERRLASEKIWDKIEAGAKFKGVVKSITNYGVFVDIGGVDGMIHVSELSWKRIRHPSDVMSIGDEVEVYVISADPEKKKISLGYKKASENPWSIFAENYKKGDVITVKVVKLMPFGAFAEIIPGIDGLIHISQISDRRITRPGEVLSEGMTVDVVITDIDLESKKISLSIRALLENPVSTADEAAPEGAGAAETPAAN
jgi:4-hydroxy-3-methylbut-2-enyl diphosphate reductase